MNTDTFMPARRGDIAIAEWRCYPNVAYVIVRVTSVTRTGLVKEVQEAVGPDLLMRQRRDEYDRLWIVPADDLDQEQVMRLVNNPNLFRSLDDARERLKLCKSK